METRPTLYLPTHELNSAPIKQPADIAAKKKPYNFTPPKESAKEGSIAIVIPIEKLATMEPIKKTPINERKTIEKPSLNQRNIALLKVLCLLQFVLAFLMKRTKGQ